jgi:acyl carrier protein
MTSADRETLRTVQTILAQFLADTDGTPPEAIQPSSQVMEVVVNSVQMLQLHARLEDAFGLEIAASALLDAKTVGGLADYLNGCQRTGPGPVQGHAAGTSRH